MSQSNALTYEDLKKVINALQPCVGTDDNIKSKLVKSKSVSGTTDGNGFVGTGITTSDVPLWANNLYVDGSRALGTISPRFLYDTNMNRVSVQFESWERNVMYKNKSVSFTIYYISN